MLDYRKLVGTPSKLFFVLRTVELKNFYLIPYTSHLIPITTVLQFFSS